MKLQRSQKIMAEFFWEVFEWKEMEPYIEEAKEDVK